MAAVRIPADTRTPFPWRRAGLIGGWALSLLIVGGILGWYLWMCHQDNDALAAEIVNLQARIGELNDEKAALVQQYSAGVAELRKQHTDRTAALKEQHAEQVAKLNEQHTKQVAELNDDQAELSQQHTEQVVELNDEMVALEQRNAVLSDELADCQANVRGIIQRGDRLESELDDCLIELNRPQRVQIVLPDLLRDETTTIFVIDDSGSMASEIIKMQEALYEMQQKSVSNARLSIVLFGDSYTTLFNFTDPASAPWDYAIGEIRAAHGGTDINLAMQAAFDSIKDERDSSKRIVLLTDGHGFIDAETLVAIQNAQIPVDTIAFGPLADHRLLARLAEATDGIFTSAN